jgi:uncharacterized membrane protein YfcA
MFAGLVLLYIGVKLINDLIKKRGDKKEVSAEDEFNKLVRDHHTSGPESGRNQTVKKKLPETAVKKIGLDHIVYEFYGRNFEINTLGILTLSFAVGIIGGIYGIGGGAIIAPFFVGFFGLPVYTVAGAALMGTFVTSVGGVIFYQLIALFYPDMTIAPDWTLGILFGSGGLAGIYCGARLQKYVPAGIIKIILAICIFSAAARYIFVFFK